MARNVPGVGKTENGKGWYATSYDPTPEKGKPRKVRVKDPVTGTSVFKTQAAAIAAKEHFELVKGTTRAGEWTADAWVAEWTTNKAYARNSASTNVHNAERVSKFATDFKGKLLSSITPKQARDWAAKNKGRVGAVRAMLGDAVRDEITASNPFAKLGLTQSQGRKNIAPLTKQEVALLANIADELFPDWPVLSSAVITAAYSGMRFGEIAGLEWDDIDWERGEINVRRQLRRDGIAPPKNGEQRTIVLLDPVAHALRKIPREDDDYVFHSRRDSKPYAYHVHVHFWSLARTAFYASLPAERQAVIGPAMEFHELRHFCGSYLADMGVSAMDIANQLGHTDGGRLAQQLYIHTYKANARDRIRKAVEEDFRSEAV